MRKIAIVSGSHRAQSQSGKVARFIQHLLQTEFGAVSCFVLDLGVTPMPLWDPGLWEGTPRWTEVWGPVSAELQTCGALVIVSPEWSGMAPAALKNFFLLCNRQELSHKPGLIVGVSSSGNGAYPIAELRMSSYKNTQLCYIPEHIIVRDVRHVLNSVDLPEGAGREDIDLRRRMKYALSLLVEYEKALEAVRGSGVVDSRTYPFGM
jgi:NAD(P)H-dependent FMN reductase